MGDIDPETQALMRKLHRELNGLTRSTRPRGAGAKQIGKAGGLAGQHRGSRRTGTPSEEEDSEASSSSSGSEAGEGREEEDDNVAKRPRKDHGGESQLQGKQQQQLKYEGSPACPDGGNGITIQMPEPFKTPMEAAAAASAHHVRDKVKASAANQSTTGLHLQRSVLKVFHAGVRWGIMIPRNMLKTRADLATQLNDVFAGEILSCGRGDILDIVFLDAEGRATEFPALRTSGARDSSSHWKASVEHALKVYVRRG